MYVYIYIYIYAYVCICLSLALLYIVYYSVFDYVMLYYIMIYSRFIKGGGVQWKQGVMICMVLHTSLQYDTTPVHCTPLRLHPPSMNTLVYYTGTYHDILCNTKLNHAKTYFTMLDYTKLYYAYYDIYIYIDICMYVCMYVCNVM